MRKRIGKIFNIRIAALLALMAVMTASYLSGAGLLAKMASSGTASESARTAAFVFRYGEELKLDLSEVKKPGDKAEYTFTVSNRSGGMVSEVSQAYRLKAALHGSMPVVCTITKSGSTEAVLELDAAAGTDPDKEEISTAVSMQAGSEQTDTYILEAEWPRERNDVKYANGCGTSSVTISASAEQTD